MAGRKKVKIDWEYAGRLAESFCKGVEIAAALGIHYNTLENRCKEDKNCDLSEFLRQKRAKGQKTLRQLQLKSAMEGSIPMQMFLGKQYLGQSDKKEVKEDSIQKIIIESGIEEDDED